MPYSESDLDSFTIESRRDIPDNPNFPGVGRPRATRITQPPPARPERNQMPQNNQNASGGGGNGMLRIGASGDAVRQLQEQLRAAGYDIAADGQFGPRTQAAVQQFQQANGLSVDGVVGPDTLNALNGGGGNGAPIPQPRPDSVGELMDQDGTDAANGDGANWGAIMTALGGSAVAYALYQRLRNSGQSHEQALAGAQAGMAEQRAGINTTPNAPGTMVPVDGNQGYGPRGLPADYNTALDLQPAGTSGQFAPAIPGRSSQGIMDVAFEEVPPQQALPAPRSTTPLIPSVVDDAEIYEMMGNGQAQFEPTVNAPVRNVGPGGTGRYVPRVSPRTNLLDVIRGTMFR